MLHVVLCKPREDEPLVDPVLIVRYDDVISKPLGARNLVKLTGEKVKMINNMQITMHAHQGCTIYPLG